MLKVFHLAAQYLATTAISFLDKKDDDSHTNLGWEDKSLHTHYLSDQHCTLSLNYKNFSLLLANNQGYKEEFFLDGKTHFQIITWIRGTSLQAKLNKVYEYKLHYELPYEEVTSDFVFQKPSDEVIAQSIKRRNLAQEALETALESLNIQSPIRIWPHHFDTGSFFMATDEIGIGLGMAVPDTMIDDFYLYVSGYKGHDAIEISDATSLNNGRYYNQGWKGFALPVANIKLQQAVNFFTQAIHQYLKK